LKNVWGGFLVGGSLLHIESSIQIGDRLFDFDRMIEPGDQFHHLTRSRRELGQAGYQVAAKERDKLRAATGQLGEPFDAFHYAIVHRMANTAVVSQAPFATIELVCRTLRKNVGVFDPEIHPAGGDRRMNVCGIARERHVSDDFLRRDPVTDVK
jgi:hypothetical protein